MYNFDQFIQLVVSWVFVRVKFEEYGMRVSLQMQRLALVLLCLAAVLSVLPAAAQQRRERESNSEYAARRNRLAVQMDAPVLLLGYTGREEESENYLFSQDENFYYLTGHNEESAALLLLPTAMNFKKDDWPGAREILFLPPKNPLSEQWNGVRLSPDDPGIATRTGFAEVKPMAELRPMIERLAKSYSTIYTVLPYQKEMGGYPHDKETVDWLKQIVPQMSPKDVRPQITALRVVKSPSEIALIRQAVDLSVDSHLDAMKMMRPGLWEYQVAAKMVNTHAMGGSEAEAYAPIVGAGPNSTVLHYDKLARKIADGDIVVLDVGAQYSGYTSDITRTIPANGKFTPRQREIYDLVLGAQNAALAQVKPGALLGCRGDKHSLDNVAREYINKHGKDVDGKPLGKYFIHGLGHNVGLNVHDPGDYCKPLQAGQVITIEPGIYIPQENLGVRIEDDVLVTPDGYELLSAKLPRDPEEIEKLMAAAAKERAEKSTN